jgi:hypothetical protein
VWDQSILSCVYAANTINPNSNPLNPLNPLQPGGQPAVVNPPTTPSPSITAGQPSNPCTQTAIQAGLLFFPYPSDSTKYIQCDLWGQAFVNSCPSRLQWNAALQTCYSPFLQGVPSGK